MSKPAASLPRSRADREHLLRPRSALHGGELAASRRSQQVIDARANRQGPMGRRQPGVARATDDGAAEAASEGHAGRRDVRRWRRHADQRPEPHARHGHRRAAGDSRAARRRPRSPAGGRRRRPSVAVSGCEDGRRSRASICRCASSAASPVRRARRRDVIAAWEAAIPKLLADPAYQQHLHEEQPAARFHSARRVREVHERVRPADGSVPQGIRRHPVNRDLVFGSAMLALAVGYYLLAAQIPESQLADAVGPQGLPKIYADVLGGLSLVLIARALRASSAEPISPPRSGRLQPARPGPPQDGHCVQRKTLQSLASRAQSPGAAPKSSAPSA